MAQTSFLVKAAVTEAQLAALARKQMKEFFPEYANLPEPRFKLISTKTARLGACAYRPGAPTTTISIQRSIAEIPESLESVMAHELIHHIDFLVNGKDDPSKVTHHGFFLELAAKVNKKRGKNFVTPESDSALEADMQEEFFTLIVPLDDGRLAIQSSKKLNDAQKKYIAAKIVNQKARIIKAKSMNLYRQVNAIGSNTLSIPLEQNEVKDLYKKADKKLQKEFSVFDKAQPYTLLVYPTLKDKLGYAYSLKVSSKEQGIIDRSGESSVTLTTTDPQWLSGSKIGSGHVSIPSDPERQAELHKLYKKHHG